MLANYEAAKLQQRFIDKDLNRCFYESDLADHTLSALEDRRAKEINDSIGTNGSSPQDLIVDLHTTTANMGITLICESTPGNILIAGSVKVRCPHVKIYCFPTSSGIRSTIRSIAPYGIGIEIGPIPQNVLRHDIFQAMDQVSRTILDVVHDINTDGLKEDKLEVDAYEHVRHVSYPDHQTGGISLIHKDLQDKDYCALKQGAPIFTNGNQGIIIYEESKDLFPVFVNEAAYYEKNIAFSLTQKRKFSISLSGSDPVFFE